MAILSGLTISGGGITIVGGITPAANDPYFMYNTLLLPGNGTNGAQNNTFLDGSTNNFSITRNGNTTQGTLSPYGSNWSNYFDGASDYLRKAGGGVLTSSGDVTIECWIYPASTTVVGLFDGGTGEGEILRNFPANKICRQTNEATGAEFTVTANTWQHFACTFTSGNIKVFINGSLNASGTYSSTYNSGSNFDIGVINTGSNGSFNGYISNFRVTRSILYTTTFTPSTTPLTSIANTTLLTCQSNRLIDNSISNFALTRNGDVSVQKFSPFSPSSVTPTSYSGNFDGTGDYLSLATNAAFNITSGSTDSFICEFWVYFSSVAANTSLVDNGGLSGATFSNWQIALDASQQFRIIWGTSSSQDGILSSSVIPTVGQWYHVAMVKTNADWALFINSTRVISYNGINTASKDSATPLFIAYGLATTAGGNGFNGLISNVRIYKGATASAPYLATSTTITVPTSPLTSITNTSLLTCQSSTFIDNSTNNFAITAFGNSQPSIQNPFGYTSTTTEGYTTSTIGGSGYFDGTGDVLVGPTNNTVFQLTGNGGTGLTVEAWIYPISVTGSKAIVNYYTYTDGSAEQGWAFRVLDGQLQAINSFGGTSRSGGSIPVNTWTHVAFVINSTSFYLYVNGVSVGTVTGIGSQNYDGATLVIGGLKQNGTYTNQVFNGYISNLRTTNTVVYASNFVPPLAPVTAVSGTQLLANMTNAGIIDNAMMNNLETVGNAQISTTQSQFGGSSMYFDGTGDYLSTYNPSYSLSVGSGDFTFECWLYVNSLPGTVTAVYHLKNDAALATTVFVLEITPTGAISISTGLAIIANGTSGKITTGSWIHFAFVRTSGVFKTFFNGTQDISTSNTTTYNGTYLQIGAFRYTAYDFSLNGYIDDLRVTKGYARYTANFTPPTTAFSVY